MIAVSGTGYFKRITSALIPLFLLALVLTGIRLVAYPQTARAAGTIYVSTTGHDTTGNGTFSLPYRSITKGLDIAVSGDIIIVRAGEYNTAGGENFPISLKTGVVLLGVGASYATISGDAWNPVISAISVDSSAKIDGFTIIRGGNNAGSGSYGGGIFCQASSPTISNNIITANTADTGGGIYCGDASPTILGNTISGNSSRCGAGIYCWASSPVISNNTITGNLAILNTAKGDVNRGGGINLDNTSSPTISNTTIYGNIADNFGGGICSFDLSCSPTIFNSIVWGNTNGGLYGCSATFSDIQGGGAGAGNITEDPRFADTGEGDFRLLAGSPCIDTGTAAGAPATDKNGVPRPRDAGFDMGAYEYERTAPITVYVNAVTGSDSNTGSVGSPFKTIKKGLTRVYVTGDTVSVAAGTYDTANGETFPINLVSGVILQGAGASSSTIWGNAASSVIYANGSNTTTKIDGFRITGGSFSMGDGGGIECVNASPIISNNYITGNTAYGGGGIALHNSSSTIINNTISGNTGSMVGGGIKISFASAPIISNNAIFENTTYGIGGGISCDYNYASTPAISNNTIVGNSALAGGGGVYCDVNSAPNVFNCIVWNNGDDFSGCAATYSDIEDGDAGTGNISADPQFVNAAEDDYRLLFGSPCIDTGTSAGAPLTDKNGLARPQVAGFDMGAYEYRIIYVNAVTGNNANGGTPAAPFKTITKGMEVAVSNDIVNVAAGTYNVAIGEAFPINLKSGVILQGAGAATTVMHGTGFSSVVQAVMGVDSSARIDGFTITGGGNVDFGGGIYIRSSSPAVSNNIITENTALVFGGGISCSYSQSVITNNTIAENTVPNGQGGGIFCYEWSPTITNNLITGNTASNGGGIGCGAASTPLISNNTITGNTADFGAGIQAWSPAVIFNCIIRDNIGPDFEKDLSVSAATYSCIGTGSTGGTGNTTEDPQFKDAANNDYRLKPDSPCVDFGTATGAPATDKNGVRRPQGAGYDMGAYEYVTPDKIGILYDYGASTSAVWTVTPDGNIPMDDWAQAWVSGNGSWEAWRSRPLAADYDGDGSLDIVIFYDYGNATSGIWAMRNNGAGYDEPIPIWTSDPGSWDSSRSKPMIGDYNNDGYDDIVIFYDYGNATSGIWTLENDKAGSFEPPTSIWTSDLGSWDAARSKPMIGDYNNDGYDDIVIFYDYGNATSGIWTFTNNAGTFVAPTTSIWTSGAGSWDAARSKPMIGDYNKDGYNDIIVFYDYGYSTSAIWTFRNNAGSTFVPPSAPVWASNTGSWDAARSRPMIGDLNGDSRDDIVVFYDYGNDTSGVLMFANKDGVSDQKWYADPVSYWTSNPGAWAVSRSKVFMIR